MPDFPPGSVQPGHQDRISNSAATVDWHVMWQQEAAKFQAETVTTTFLAGLLHAAGVKCQRCSQPGRVVVVRASTREWVCDICVARTPDFEARLAARMREDKPLLDRLAEGPPDA